jgi:hypothetical protein
VSAALAIASLGSSSGPGSPAVVWDSGVNGWDWNAIKPVSGDFNGDGKTDIGVFCDSGLGNWDWTAALVV